MCLRLGYPTVRHLFDTGITRRELVEWFAYIKINGPIDDSRSDEYTKYLARHFLSPSRLKHTPPFNFSWEPDNEYGG